MLLSVFISVISIILILYINVKTGRHISPYRLVSDSNAVMAIVISTTSFMFFKNVNIPYNKYINIIGASTFGVLLIHANSETMRRWLWKDVLDNAGHYADEYFWIRPIVAVLLIFAVCVVTDVIRIHLFERPFFELVDKKKQ